MIRILYKSIFLALLCILVVSTTFAQSTPDLSIESIPSNPAPFSSVQLSVSSYAIDVNQATITWKYNNKIISSGIGKRTVTITAPNSGVVATVEAMAEAPGIDPITETITINPASVDVLWEALDSYTPPFYKGKAKPSTGALIKVVAIPAYNAPKQLSFEWTHNDSAAQDASGIGKSSVVFKNNYLTTIESVGVVVKGGLFGGTGTTDVAIGEPSLVGYFNNGGFIDYANGSTSKLTTNEKGATLHIEPYFFSSQKNITNDIVIGVTASDGVAIEMQGPKKNEFAFSAPENGSDVTFSVAIRTVQYSLQQLKRAFTVSFF